MKDGDLDTYAEQIVVLVLEGLLAEPQYTGRLRKKLLPAITWNWQQLALRRMVQWHRSNVSVDVVTFLSEEVADAAAAYLMKYGYDFGAVDYLDFDQFCDALIVRHPTAVFDSDPIRLNRYGQFGVAVMRGEDFA